MALEVLEELGLTKSEIKVYLALLELGQSTTGPVVDKAEIASSKIYEILEKLVNKGLVSYVLKGSVKYFEATQPERILDLLKEKEKDLERRRKEIQKMLPELTRKKELSKYKENASIYKGMKGLETVFYESINLMKKNDIMYSIGIPQRSEKVNRFFLKLDKYRASKGIPLKALFNEKARGELQTLPENMQLEEIKFMAESVITPAAINVLNNRTIIFPSETTEEPLLIMIENKEVADSFRAQFKLLWNQTTISFTGIEWPKYVVDDIIRADADNYAFGLDDKKLEKYVPDDLKKLIQYENTTKHQVKLLFIEGYKQKESTRAKIRYLPKSYNTPMHYEIYGNKVAMINWDNPITTIITDNKAMADSFRIYFNNLWKIAKEK